jgi:hypothetical protein
MKKENEKTGKRENETEKGDNSMAKIKKIV